MTFASRRRRPQSHHVASPMVILAALILSGCTISSGIPGAPDIEIAPGTTAAQDACREYAGAFNENSTREGITAGVEAAQRTAAAATDDPDAQKVADAIDQFLTNTVMGTEESLNTANNAVLAACRDVGINITVE